MLVVTFCNLDTEQAVLHNISHEPLSFFLLHTEAALSEWNTVTQQLLDHWTSTQCCWRITENTQLHEKQRSGKVWWHFEQVSEMPSHHLPPPPSSLWNNIPKLINKVDFRLHISQDSNSPRSKDEKIMWWCWCSTFLCSHLLLWFLPGWRLLTSSPSHYKKALWDCLTYYMCKLLMSWISAVAGLAGSLIHIAFVAERFLTGCSESCVTPPGGCRTPDLKPFCMRGHWRSMSACGWSSLRAQHWTLLGVNAVDWRVFMLFTEYIPPYFSLYLSIFNSGVFSPL